jgi:hypothetical protein
MAATLLDRLFDEEITQRDRTKFLEALASQSSGKRSFNFNVFNVILDFDSQTVIVEDVLESDVSMTVSIDEFGRRLRSGRGDSLEGS